MQFNAISLKKSETESDFISCSGFSFLHLMRTSFPAVQDFIHAVVVGEVDADARLEAILNSKRLRDLSNERMVKREAWRKRSSDAVVHSTAQCPR